MPATVPSRIRLLAQFTNRDLRAGFGTRSLKTIVMSLIFVGASLLSIAKLWFLGLPNAAPVFTVDRFKLLDMAIDSAPSQGLWLEFGVYRGDSINYIAERSGREVFGFDSFEGLPQKWGPRNPAGTFSTDGRMPEVRNGVNLIRGWFEETLPVFLEEHRGESAAFIHVDCDLYSSTLTVLRCLGPRMTDRTVVVFDEFCTPHPDDEARAWFEFSKMERIAFSWLGCSAYGSVALRVDSKG